MPDFTARADADEMMDDFSITDARLAQALEDLRGVNRWLGGYAATRAVLRPLVRRRRTLRLLDLGTGIADYPEHLVRWADRHGTRLDVVAIDANPVTVEHARTALDRRLPVDLRGRIHVDVGDALDLPFGDGAFDVVHAALFMHHLGADQAVRLLRAMQRIGRYGCVVNDLHRHPLAYYGIQAVGHLLPTSEMFQHDAPLSVLRGFQRAELEQFATEADLPRCRLRWHWAFRWTLATLPSSGF